MSTPVTSSVSKALTQLRRAVTVGCWVVGLALAVQLFIWSLAVFTDMRFDEVAYEAADTPLVIESERREGPRNRTNGLPLPPNANNGANNAASPDEQADAANQPTRATNALDRYFALAHNAAGGVGRSGMLIILVLVPVGLAIGISSCVHGIEKGIGALIAALLLAILVLPLGSMLGLPWQGGALSSYDLMTERADHLAYLSDPARRFENESASNARSASAASSGAHAANGSDSTRNAQASAAAAQNEADGWAVFLVRFGALPAVCIIGVTVLGLRFAASIEAAMIPIESMRLDPALEREAANITPTSLHGIRGGNAFSRNVPENGEKKANGHAPEPAPERSIRQPNPGEAPKRLI